MAKSLKQAYDYWQNQPDLNWTRQSRGVWEYTHMHIIHIYTYIPHLFALSACVHHDDDLCVVFSFCFVSAYMYVCVRTYVHTQHNITPHTPSIGLVVDLFFWMKFLEMRRQSSTDFYSTKYSAANKRQPTQSSARTDRITTQTGMLFVIMQTARQGSNTHTGRRESTHTLI